MTKKSKLKINDRVRIYVTDPNTGKILPGYHTATVTLVFGTTTMGIKIQVLLDNSIGQLWSTYDDGKMVEKLSEDEYQTERLLNS